MKKKNIKIIDQCQTVHDMVHVVRKSSNLFTSYDRSKSIFGKLLAYQMKSKDPSSWRQLIFFKNLFYFSGCYDELDWEHSMHKVHQWSSTRWSQERCVNRKIVDAAVNKVIIIINTHHAQESANTVNDFSKMSHDNTELFNNVATSTIPIIDTFNA